MLMWLSGAILVAIALAVAYLGILVLCESRKPRVMCLMYHRLAPRDAYAQAKGTERIFTVAVEEAAALYAVQPAATRLRRSRGRPATPRR